MHILPAHVDRMGAHHHPHHELVYCCTPGYAVTTDGERHEPAPGTACYYPPGHHHQGTVVDRCTILLLQWQEEGDGRDRRRFTHDPDGRLLVLLDWLLEEWIRAAPDTTAQAKRVLACVVGALAPTDGDAPPPRMDTPIRRMMRTIRDHFPEDLHLDRLARVAGLSKWQLVRECKAQLGETPGAILRRTRLRAARNLLADGRELGEVVRAVGYTNGRALARALRGEYGQGPSELQRIPLAHEMEHGRDSWWRK